MIRFKVRLAIRNLLKNKLYSILIIGGFAIGFTASLLIAIFYSSEHSVNKSFADSDRIFRLYDADKTNCSLDYNLNEPLSANYFEIERACPVEYTSSYTMTLKDPETHNYTRVSHIITTNNSFFDIFSVKVISSISETPFSQLNAAVISKSVAQRLFGDKNPLGRNIHEDFFSAVVTAVIQDFPENSSMKADIMLNIKDKDFQMSQECNDGYCIYPVEHFIMLKKSTASELLVSKLNSSLKTFIKCPDNLALQPLTDIYLSSLPFEFDSQSKGNARMVFLFLSIAILILLLSSINYLNYTLSRQYANLKGIGINKVNGAGKWQLLYNSFLEVSLGIFIALIISIFLTISSLPLTNQLFGRTLSFADVDQNQFIIMIATAIIAIVILNSLAPVYIISNFSITDFLNGERKSGDKQYGKQTMLTFQLITSMALISLVFVIFKQLQYVNHYDLGFKKNQLLKIELPYNLPGTNALITEIKKLPFVSGATLSSGNPGRVAMMMGNGLDDDEFMVNCLYVGDNYLSTMGIKLIEGRDFNSGDNGSVCLMNEKAVKRYGWNSIDNKKFNNGREGGYKVIGVVSNFNVESLHSAISPVAILYGPNRILSTLSLRLVPGNSQQQIKDLKNVWQTIVPNDPMEFTFYGSQFQAMYSKEERLAKSLTFFSIIALTLTCMGILGQIFIISFTRVKEIGIRKVNGARTSEILALLNKDFVKWVIIAFCLATPIAWYMSNKWLESFAYRTRLSWWVFVLSGVITLFIALITVSWQSLRAARRNPVEALRYE